MDTKQLQLFAHLAETLHFAQTANHLHMSPSAVSRAIVRMEEELGQRLLERDNRSVRLTAAGRQFQDYAKQALSQWQRFNASMAQDAKHISGEVSVFCSVTAVYSVLADILEPFRHRYPAIDIKLHTGDHAEAVDRVYAGHEDVAIAARPDKLSSKLQFQTLLHSPLLFIYPTMHCQLEQSIREHLAQGQKLPWHALPFIFSEHGVARSRLDQWFRQQEVKPNIYAQVSGNEAIVSMVSLGFGVGLVPELVLLNSPLRDKVQVLDVQPPLAPFAVGVCALSQRMESPQLRAFWECAKASYQIDF
ncbi:HTH-type transcriptional activator IlvY [Dasania sp. GY-MA-18]|uniref:HTH-type transcriptional activator IlvY n=1 Tax=Dasania phycosphaerae TaxID=2950436 RepID=A0A9J6RNX1_9GAMM|nr:MULTISPECIES: HTH-type transcriptional activator IlvY [Dasania]MCR8923575.1 HTH-type transcriptional activator IlvY [Dasania sp. GY-MA-18]MCZ0866009.1 HTH-type transcriptional activator IlvY [Dasania phycosphaerae]MCZ0869733.1 HTH-type transcriptional activator IlvY [Dasania phycosphaerae]